MKKMMTRSSHSDYHPNFIKYMNEIINHPNYKGLSIKYKSNGSPVWLATKKSETGKKRIEWIDRKADELKIDSSKKMTDTMFAIHPTKKKACQICGETMDLHYIYPTKNTINYFEKNFGYEFNKYDSIKDIVLQLPEYENDIKDYLIDKLSLDKKCENASITEIINTAEYECRMGNKSIFSPGAMGNPPDRFDGFHSYNLCCRKYQDKGRHDSNMATYNKDRRAYEYWSDGNIAAANQLMRDASIFTGMSADHIGPISLGFIHDPLYLQPMVSSDNSSKRDRLYDEDILKLINIERVSGVSPASFFSKELWEFIKQDYTSKRQFTLEWYREILKQNMVNFMESLWILLNIENRFDIEKFFSEIFFEPKYEKYFKYRYEFNSDGSIKNKILRNITDSSKKEFSRFQRISYESVDDFHLKSDTNRKNSANISKFNRNLLIDIQNDILNNAPYDMIIHKWNHYLITMQKELLLNNI
ncbi:Alw26I/Eco31I/Esp3I family type II restriction endonuclease [Listeria welshimeri]|nr:Alw26I/Eco31I/Esp3I family type II restriction endonuclease [Listeria welshimeri]